jgi:hypothetical protein
LRCIKRPEDFPCAIKQERFDWCIPASIEAVTRYHYPASAVTQGYIWTQFDLWRRKTGNGIGLEHVRTVLGEDPNFSQLEICFHRGFSGFSEFASELRQHVNRDNPPIMSVHVPQTQSEHMWVVVAYDDTYWRIYDPDPSQITCYRLVKQSPNSLHENGERQSTDVFVLRPKDRIT